MTCIMKESEQLVEVKFILFCNAVTYFLYLALLFYLQDMTQNEPTILSALFLVKCYDMHTEKWFFILAYLIAICC